MTLAAGATRTGEFRYTTSPADVPELTTSLRSDDDQASTTVSVTEPAGGAASFAVEVSTNTPVSAGESLSAEVTVENTGDAEGTQTISVDAGGLGSESVQRTLQAGGSETVSFTFDTAADEAGEYELTASSDDDQVSTTVTVQETGTDAVFLLSDTSADEPTEGEFLTVEFTVENTGTEAATRTVVVDAGGLGTFQVPTELEPGASSQEAVRISTGEGDAGGYTVTIDSGDEVATLPQVRVRQPEPFFEVTSVGSNSPVEVGQQLSVDVTVRNVGEAQGQTTVDVQAGGLGSDQRSISLAPSGAQTLQFVFGTGAGDAGTYTVSAVADGQAQTQVQVTEPEVVDLSLSLGPTTIVEGDSTGVSVTAQFSDGSSEDVTAEATLTSSDPGVASVAGSTVSGESPGSATITASLEGTQASAGLTVESAAEPEFQITGLVMDPTQGPEGTTFVAETSVTNTGDAQGQGTVTIAAGGLGTNQQSVSLAPGESTTFNSLFPTGSGDAGTYTVTASIGGSTRTAQITVT